MFPRKCTLHATRHIRLRLTPDRGTFQLLAKVIAVKAWGDPFIHIHINTEWGARRRVSKQLLSVRFQQRGRGESCIQRLSRTLQPP
jgi:hypothetical protein